jgi:hypothetical protein
MPITFRCLHCSHLLGISRSKAGDLVDCPACGRTIRVPDLDGKIRPVTTEGINPADPRLMQAFEDLAEIEAQPVEMKLEPRVKVSTIPAPPIPKHEIKVLAPPTQQVHQQNEVTINDDPLDEIATIIQSVGSPSKSKSNQSTSLLDQYGIAIAAAGIAFVLGFLLGRTTAPAKQPVKEIVESKPAVDPNVPQLKSAEIGMNVTGRITYNLASGESRPDRGARVLILPAAHTEKQKLPTLGLRAGDSQADFETAQTALRAFGGDVALADIDGKYKIKLKEPGSYYIIVLSRFAPKVANEQIDTRIIPVLSEHFESPNELLGKVGYYLSTLQLNSTAPVTWDHIFKE